MKDAPQCIRTAVILSVAFLLIFTSYGAIENLETSIIRGECQGCLEGSPSGICQSGNVCQEKTKFACDEACSAPFKECESSLGRTILGTVYLTFTLTSLVGPVVPNYFGMKKSLFGSALIYALFAFANLIVALNPTNQDLHWWIMIPAAVLEGVAASVLWIAQAAYLTEVSVLYSKYKHEPLVSSMGFFNGLFYSIFRLSAILGNFISSFVLGFLVWSSQSLFVLYTLLGLSGATLMLALPALTQEGNDAELVKLVPASTNDAPESPPTVATEMSALWEVVKDKRMLMLAPVFILSGLEQGFASGEFTSNFIRESLGSSSIGYVMAIYGSTNVVASFAFGRLADKFGPLSGVLIGFGSLLTAFCMCYWIPVAKCDEQWTLVMTIAVLLSFGDASSATLISVVLGQEFPSDPLSAFSVFKVYQSGSTAAAYFFFSFLSFNGRLLLLICMVLISISAFLVYTKKYRRVSIRVVIRYDTL